MAMATAEDLELQERTTSLGGGTYGAPQAYYPQVSPMFDPAPLPVLKYEPGTAPVGTAPAPSSPCSNCKHAPQPVIPSGGMSPTGTGGYIGLPGTGGPKVDLFAPTDSAGNKLKITGAEGMAGGVPWWLWLILLLIVLQGDEIRRQLKAEAKAAGL